MFSALNIPAETLLFSKQAERARKALQPSL
jgi:hypothetical protein